MKVLKEGKRIEKVANKKLAKVREQRKFASVKRQVRLVAKSTK